MWHKTSHPVSYRQEPVLLVSYLLVISFALTVGAPENALSQSQYRFGQDLSRTSISFLVGSSVVSGAKRGIGANGFEAAHSADLLYERPRHFAFEYAEHRSRNSLAYGLQYTQIVASENLRTELGLAEDASLSVGYLDVPITYRINAFPAGKAQLNISAGFSIIPMLDVAISSASVFESGSNATTSGAGASTGPTGELTNKHLDFGFGFGGEVELERRVAPNFFFSARAGFRRPFSGVTRPNFGFILVGIRIYQ